jgi:SNF2 family DNA or RNA helicase
MQGDIELMVPFEYQTEGIIRGIKHPRIIVADEMGLGKTGATLRTIRSLTMHEVLVVCPKSAIWVWKDEIQKWLGPDEAVFIGLAGRSNPRKRMPNVERDIWIREYQAFIACPFDRKVFITNYAQLGNIIARKRWWPAIVYDEAHIFRNGARKKKVVNAEGAVIKKGIQVFENAQQLVSDYIFPITGSPVVNGPKDLWPLLNLIQPAVYRSYWGFVGKYCHIIHNGYGIEILGPKDPEALKVELTPHIIRRLKVDVAKWLPPKLRSRIPYEMTPSQKKLYDQMADEMIATVGPDEDILAPNKLTQMTRLRQILISPLLLTGLNDGYTTWITSGLFDVLTEKVESEMLENHAIVIFSPYLQALKLVRDYLLEEAKLKFQPFYVNGKMTAQALGRNIQGFQESSGPRILFASVQMSTSWTATAASSCYFVGYDWSPSINEQAEDRLHRTGQLSTVNAYYFTAKGTIDEYILKVLERKTTWAKLSLGQALKPKEEVNDV